MIISRLRLKNWKNFKAVDIHLLERVYIIGPNASGKSNLLDALKFLRDIAKTEGGGLQRAIKDRGGIKKLRCLFARKDTEVLLEIELSENADSAPKWKYVLGFKGEGKGANRVIVSKELVQNLETNKTLLDRPDISDLNDPDQLTQTRIEQISANKDFRDISDFLGSFLYLHLVPQLLKYADQLGGYRLENDPFGQAFLEKIAKTTERTRASRLSKIEMGLKTCVPNMGKLRYVRDETTGTPHLEALFGHWRPDAGWQREDQFSDGTLRLLGIMWNLLDGNSPLMLEEPELSLNEDIVRRIHTLIWQMQRQAKYSRQIFITTHSEALLSDQSINPDEVIRLEQTSDGTVIEASSQEEKKLIKAGYSVAEVMLPKNRPSKIDQLALF